MATLIKNTAARNQKVQPIKSIKVKRVNNETLTTYPVISIRMEMADKKIMLLLLTAHEAEAIVKDIKELKIG